MTRASGVDTIRTAELLPAPLSMRLLDATSRRETVLEVVRIVELDPIPVSTGSDSLRLRIEILKELGRVDRYRARLLRWDTYRIVPSFGSGGDSSSADEEILVADPLWDSQGAAAPTAREALALVLSRLRDQLPGAGIPDLDSIDG